MTDTTSSPLNTSSRFDDERIEDHLGPGGARQRGGDVERAFGGRGDRPCNAQRYERSAARRDTRAGHYERKLQTKAGEVSKVRQQTFETAIIDYRRRESSVEEASIETIWLAFRCAGWRTSLRSCGAREFRRRRCQT
jgi:putative transposase